MAKHTVKRGESLWSIAVKYFGDGNRYKDIMKINNLKTELIHPNQVIEIPSTSSSSSNAEIGKAFITALEDVENLPSVKKLKILLESR